MTSPILGNFIYVNEKKIGVCGDPAHLVKSHVQAMLHINYLHVSGTERDERQARMTIGEIYQQELDLVTPDISIKPVRDLCDWQLEHETQLEVMLLLSLNLTQLILWAHNFLIQ